MIQATLLKRIEDFAEGHGIAPATVTSRAVQNSRLYRRMKDGGGCTIAIAEKLTAYMDSHGVGEASPQREQRENT